MLDRRLAKPTSVDAEQLAIDALGYIASEPDLMRRFWTCPASKRTGSVRLPTSPGFFVGVLDFLLANENDVVAFSHATGTPLEAVQISRDKLDRGPDRLTLLSGSCRQMRTADTQRSAGHLRSAGLSIRLSDSASFRTIVVQTPPVRVRLRTAQQESLYVIAIVRLECRQLLIGLNPFCGRREPVGFAECDDGTDDARRLAGSVDAGDEATAILIRVSGSSFTIRRDEKPVPKSSSAIPIPRRGARSGSHSRVPV